MTKKSSQKSRLRNIGPKIRQPKGLQNPNELGPVLGISGAVIFIIALTMYVTDEYRKNMTRVCMEKNGSVTVPAGMTHTEQMIIAQSYITTNSERPGIIFAHGIFAKDNVALTSETVDLATRPQQSVSWDARNELLRLRERIIVSFNHDNSTTIYHLCGPISVPDTRNRSPNSPLQAEVLPRRFIAGQPERI